MTVSVSYALVYLSIDILLIDIIFDNHINFLACYVLVSNWLQRHHF